MRRLWMCVMAMVLLPVMTLPAQGAEGQGSLSVTVGHRGESCGGAVHLYRVGEEAEGGYRLTQECGGGFVKDEDVDSSMLAQWLAEAAEAEPTARILDADGNAFFSGLSRGLYLLVQTEWEPGYSPVKPFLVPIPCWGAWDVAAFPKAGKILTEPPATGQHPAPIIGAMGMVVSGLALVLFAEKIRRK